MRPAASAERRSLKPNVDVDRVDLREVRVGIHHFREAVEAADVQHMRGRRHAAGFAPSPRHGLWRALVVELSVKRMTLTMLARAQVIASSRIHQNLKHVCFPVVDSHADQRRLFAEAAVLYTAPCHERRRLKVRSETAARTHSLKYSSTSGRGALLRATGEPTPRGEACTRRIAQEAGSAAG